MKKGIVSLLLFVLCVCTYGQEDSLRTNRYVVRSTMFGVGFTNLLDTYLSPLNYKGGEFRIINERMRMTNLMKGKVSIQNMFQMNIGMANNKAATGTEMFGMANWNTAWHYQLKVNDKLKLLFGPAIDLNAGFVYNTRNSNNPAQAIANGNMDISGMAIYHFRIKNYPMIARYQMNIPMMGVMFSPEYGESYYEIFELKHEGSNVVFTTPFNRPSFRQFISLDFPINIVNLRLGYMADIQQSKVNHIKSHIWSHALVIGIVRNFYIIKGKNKVSLPSKVTAF
ncbi:MAG: DUF3316 domain-containing protein [Phocaeicola sp.]|uniref:DUF3316 domain-containing protein n=1 Tax=Phocaeicola sp. TaxID=2773926 RepID=UPI003F9F9A07